MMVNGFFLPNGSYYSLSSFLVVWLNQCDAMVMSDLFEQISGNFAASGITPPFKNSRVRVWKSNLDGGRGSPGKMSRMGLIGLSTVKKQ